MSGRRKTESQPVVMSVSCPTCAAPAGHRCRLKAGEPGTRDVPHSSRLVEYRNRREASRRRIGHARRYR